MRLLAAGYDDILGVIGPFGLWQKRTTAFLWVIIAFIGIPFLVYSFALAKPGNFYEYFKFYIHFKLRIFCEQSFGVTFRDAMTP